MKIKQRNDDYIYSGSHNLHIQDKNNYFHVKIWCKEIKAKYCKLTYVQRKPTFIGSNRHIVKSNIKRLNHVYIEIRINTSTPNVSNNQFPDNIEELQQWLLGNMSVCLVDWSDATKGFLWHVLVIPSGSKISNTRDLKSKVKSKSFYYHNYMNIVHAFERLKPCWVYLSRISTHKW